MGCLLSHGSRVTIDGVVGFVLYKVGLRRVRRVDTITVEGKRFRTLRT